MSATLIAVTGKYANADGTAAVGTVTFVLSEPIANSDVIYHQLPQTNTLSGTGAFSQTLVANDDSATSPTGSFYTVTENISDAPQRVYSIVVASASPHGTVDISTLMPNTALGVG
jgi:hypothetical protein